MNETIMKKTMNYLSMAALALVGAVMTACSSEDNIASNQQPAKQDNIVTVTTTIGLGGDNATTRALNIDYTKKKAVKTFAVGDQVALRYYNTSDKKVVAESNALEASDITKDGKSANFTFKLTNPKEGGWVTYMYPASMIGEDGNMDQKKLHSQEGTLAYVSSIDLAQGGGPMVGTALPSVTLENICAVVAFTLKDAAGTDITKSITSMTIDTISAEDQHPDIYYNITGADSDGHIYVVMMSPDGSGSKALTITATDGTNSYTKTLSGKAYQRNYFYQQGLKMTTYPVALSAVTADYIGSVVCSDGYVYPAKTAAPSGKTAVGILGKVTETGHGLILALQNATSQTWNTINSWTSVTTYAGTTLKLLPDGAHGSLASYTTLGGTAVSNWCVGQKSDYEAIFKNLGSAKDNQGYDYTYDANVNAYITTGVGGTAISGKCWSATEGSGNYALEFGSDSWYNTIKSSSESIRPVLGF